MNLLILGLGGPEVMLIVILALLLFGGKKIPELMNGIGKGVKSLRDGMEGKNVEGTTTPQVQQTPQGQQQHAADNQQTTSTSEANQETKA